jgi:hypothetical protein
VKEPGQLLAFPSPPLTPSPLESDTCSPRDRCISVHFYGRIGILLTAEAMEFAHSLLTAARVLRNPNRRVHDHRRSNRFLFEIAPDDHRFQFKVIDVGGPFCAADTTSDRAILAYNENSSEQEINPRCVHSSSPDQ